MVPAQGGAEQAATSVGLALGRFLSETIQDDTIIGVGWGRTLARLPGEFPSAAPQRHQGHVAARRLGRDALRQSGGILLAAGRGTRRRMLSLPGAAGGRQRRDPAPADRGLRSGPGLCPGRGHRSRHRQRGRHQPQLDLAGPPSHQPGAARPARRSRLRGRCDVQLHRRRGPHGRSPGERPRHVVGLDTLGTARHKLIASGGQEPGACPARRHPPHRLQHADHG